MHLWNEVLSFAITAISNTINTIRATFISILMCHLITRVSKIFLTLEFEELFMRKVWRQLLEKATEWTLPRALVYGAMLNTQTAVQFWWLAKKYRKKYDMTTVTGVEGRWKNKYPKREELRFRYLLKTKH